MDELTEFAMAEDMKAWWIPANIPTPDRQEMLYSSGHISKLDLVQTPLTLVGTNGLHVVIHEANLVDYAGMALQGRSESRTLKASPARWKDGSAVKGAHAVRDAVAHAAAGRPGGGAGSLGARTQAEPTEPHRRHAVDSAREVQRHLVGDARQHDDVEQRTAARRDHGEHAEVHRLRGGQRAGGTLVEGWNVGWDKN